MIWVVEVEGEGKLEIGARFESIISTERVFGCSGLCYKQLSHNLEQQQKDLTDRQDFAYTQNCSSDKSRKSGGVRVLSDTNSIHLLKHSDHFLDRTIEDYAVVYLGSALFKIFRLVIIAMYTVHFGACIFFRVKMNSAASPEDISSFYAENNIQDDVSDVLCLDNFSFADV